MLNKDYCTIYTLSHYSKVSANSTLWLLAWNFF